MSPFFCHFGTFGMTPWIGTTLDISSGVFDISRLRRKKTGHEDRLQGFGMSVMKLDYLHKEKNRR